MKIKGLNAKQFKIMLIVAIVVSLAATGAGFYFMLQQLRTFAVETDTLNKESSSSSQRLNQLRELDKYLTEHADDIKRAADITSSTEGYRYQDDFVKELSRLGVQSGVDVTNFTLRKLVTSRVESATPDAGSTTGLTEGSESIPSVPSSQVSSISCTVTIRSPVAYEKFITFLKLLEANPKRMQVTSVNIGNQSSGSSDQSSGESSGEQSGGGSVKDGSVSVEPLEILVYLRQ